VNRDEDEPLDLEGLSAARAAATDDLALLRLRDLELAEADVPPQLGRHRCGRLLAVDEIGLTLEATDTERGQAVLLRVLRSRWARDPVIRRRFTRPFPPLDSAALLLPSRADAEERPYLWVTRPGPSALDLLHPGGPLDWSVLAHLLGDGVLALSELQRAGLGVSGPLGATLFLDGRRFRLAWLDPFAAPLAGPDALRALGRLGARFDPEGDHPLSELASAWAATPPPSAIDAARLLRRALHSSLLEARHHLSLAGARLASTDGRARLSRAINSLRRALPPPRAKVCLRAGRDGVLSLAHSDGRSVWGGPADNTEADRLPLLYSEERGLEPAGARALLRAWATRGGGDELRRDEHQRRLGGTELDAERLVRWLSAMTRLRSSALLSAHSLQAVAARRGA
jgi:hypothetical protein